MDDRYQYNDPWNSGVYETGRTRPPKRHGGCIAGLLVLVIVLAGVISILSFLNVRLFSLLNQEKNNKGDISIQVSQEQEGEAVPPETTVPDETTLPAGTAHHIELETSPLSVPNVPQEGGLSLQEIYDKNIGSVVSIVCGNTTGTGVVLSADGYIVTNCHVVENAQSITVLLTDMQQYPARLVGADSVSDLAVLRIDAQGLEPAEFGDSTVLRVGDAVAAIGDPLGVEFRGTMTNGIVSAINRDVTTGGRTLTLIQTNAALNSGNSGGPLINCYGQVVGINTLKIGAFTDSAGVEGLGFAIPSTTVREIANQLIAQGYVSGRPSLAVTGEAVSAFDQYYFRLPAGLYIRSVESGSPAAQLGIESGDILVRLGDAAITSAEDLERALYEYDVGDTVTIVIARSGSYYQLEVPLIEARG